MKNANTVKYVGPSKKMAEALEKEGLRIDWPPTGNIEDVELLAIDAIFETGCDWEKSVLIDLRDMLALDTKAGVDNAIANQLQEAYDNFDIEEEMAMHLEGTAREREKRGVPDAARLLEDMKEQDSRLKRFAEVANAVAEGRKIPAESDEVKIEIDGATAENIVSLLEYAMNHGASEAHCKPIIDELNRKLGM